MSFNGVQKKTKSKGKIYSSAYFADERAEVMQEKKSCWWLVSS